VCPLLHVAFQHHLDFDGISCRRHLIKLVYDLDVKATINNNKACMSIWKCTTWLLFELVKFC
jgi:hypothetical protein